MSLFVVNYVLIVLPKPYQSVHLLFHGATDSCSPEGMEEQ